MGNNLSLFGIWSGPLGSEIIDRFDTVLELLRLGVNQMDGAAQARPLDPSQNNSSIQVTLTVRVSNDARTMKARRRPCVPAPRIATAASRVAEALADNIVFEIVGAFMIQDKDIGRVRV